MALYESTGKVVHPFDESQITSQRYSDFNPYPGDEQALSVAWAGMSQDVEGGGSSALSSSVWFQANTPPYHSKYNPIERC
ncbi:MAG: hypothetical protein HQM11_19405 [SAR324 cluster bacterium]|nr:hypothetical protein [SAR324 cluster bacterium]